MTHYVSLSLSLSFPRLLNRRCLSKSLLEDLLRHRTTHTVGDTSNQYQVFRMVLCHLGSIEPCGARHRRINRTAPSVHDKDCTHQQCLRSNTTAFLSLVLCFSSVSFSMASATPALVVVTASRRRGRFEPKYCEACINYNGQANRQGDFRPTIVATFAYTIDRATSPKNDGDIRPCWI